MPIFGSDDESNTVERADPSEYIWVCQDCDCVHAGEPDSCLQCYSPRLEKFKREDYDLENHPNIPVTKLGDDNANQHQGFVSILLQNNTAITLAIAFTGILLFLSAISIFFETGIVFTLALAFLLIVILFGFVGYRFISE